MCTYAEHIHAVWFAKSELCSFLAACIAKSKTSSSDTPTKLEDMEMEGSFSQPAASDHPLAGEGSVDVLFADVTTLPTLRGILNQPKGVWSGEWAMSEHEFLHGTKGTFEYKKMKRKVPRPISPFDMYIGGHFTYESLPGKKSKVPESNVLMSFTQTSEWTYSVSGFGENHSGVFHMRGTFNSLSSELRIERAYERGLIVPVQPATATAAATTTSVLDLDQPNRPRRSRSSGISAESQKIAEYVHLVDKLGKEDRSMFFAQPVDPVLVPDYLSVVSSPIDLGTIRERLHSGSYYSSAAQIKADISLMFANALLYNPKTTLVFGETKRLQTWFAKEHERLFKAWAKDDVMILASAQDEKQKKFRKRNAESEEEDFSDPTVTSKAGRKSRPPSKFKIPKSMEVELLKRVKSLEAELSAIKANPVVTPPPMAPQPSSLPRAPSVQKKTPKPLPHLPSVQLTPGEPSRLPPALDQPMSYAEMRILAQEINFLPAERLIGVMDVFQKNNGKLTNERGLQVEFDLAEQPAVCQRLVSKYVKEALKEDRRKGLVT